MAPFQIPEYATVIIILMTYRVWLFSQNLSSRSNLPSRWPDTARRRTGEA